MTTQSEEKSTTRLLLEQLINAKKRAEVDPEGLPWKTRPGAYIAANEAKNELKGLYRKLVDATVPKRLLGAYVTGSDASDFAQVVVEQGGVKLDAAALYQRLTDVVEKTLEGSRNFGVNQYSHLIAEIRKVAQEVAAGPIPGPIINVPDHRERFLNNRASTYDFVVDLVRGTCGDDLNRAVLMTEVMRAVVDNVLDQDAVPVVVLNASSAERPGLGQMFARTVTVPDWEFGAPNSSDLEEAFR